jgi:hypothetical protein
MVEFRGAFYGTTTKEKPMFIIISCAVLAALVYPYTLVGRWLAWVGMDATMEQNTHIWSPLPTVFQLRYFLLFPISAALNDEPSLCPPLGLKALCGKYAILTNDGYTRLLCVAWPIKVAGNALAITLCLIPYAVRCLAKRDGSRMTVATVS